VQQVNDTVITGPETVDQQQLIGDGSTGANVPNWQSFTAGTDGFLTAVALRVISPIMPNSSPGMLRIYAGEGTNGALLATESVTWQPVSNNTFQTNTLSARPLLQGASKYTIWFNAPAVSNAWVDISTTDPYAGGRSGFFFASWDCVFQTFMIPLASNAPVLMV